MLYTKNVGSTLHKEIKSNRKHLFFRYDIVISLPTLTKRVICHFKMTYKKRLVSCPFVTFPGSMILYDSGPLIFSTIEQWG